MHSRPLASCTLRLLRVRGNVLRRELVLVAGGCPVSAPHCGGSCLAPMSAALLQRHWPPVLPRLWFPVTGAALLGGLYVAVVVAESPLLSNRLPHRVARDEGHGDTALDWRQAPSGCPVSCLASRARSRAMVPRRSLAGVPMVLGVVRRVRGKATVPPVAARPPCNLAIR